MRSFFTKRPWMWIVVLLGAMVLANIVFVVISVRHPATPVG